VISVRLHLLVQQVQSLAPFPRTMEGATKGGCTAAVCEAGEIQNRHPSHGILAANGFHTALPFGLPLA
jgi:hypothetical protein